MSEYLEKGSQGTFVMIDLDNFKEVNDTKGHDFGDQFLIHFAGELKKAFKEGELLSRMGGDEFSIYFPQHMDKESLLDKIDKFQKSCNKLNGEYKINCSIGICFVSSYNNTFEQCYKEADLALYEAKNRGKNQFYVYHEKDEQSKGL
ncbi:MAG: GGDEF domain-containing protein [Bacilli bacterium]